jgi:hypothetical protein
VGSPVSPAKAPVSLAPFAFGWIGGDIHGLQALAARLSSYVPAMTDVITALDRRATQLTSDPRDGWQGSAASAFTASWQKDALAAAALAMVSGQPSDIVGALAVALAEIENALETQADSATRHGVQIMPGGQPGPEPFGPPSNEAQAAQQQWAISYQQVWQQAQADASQVRQQATTQLMRLYQQIAPPRKGPPSTAPGDYAILTDLLADVWAVPTASRRDVHESSSNSKGAKCCSNERSPLREPPENPSRKTSWTSYPACTLSSLRPARNCLTPGAEKML